MHLLAFLIVVWAVKHFVTHVQYAAKGMPPPRTQARLAAIEHGATGTGVGQFGTPGRERYGLRDLVADSWFDGCARVRERQVARRDANAPDRSAVVDRIEAAPSRFGWFADSAKRVGRVLWEPVGEPKPTDVTPEVAAASGSGTPVRHTGHSAYGMSPGCPACRAQYGDPAAGTNPAAGSGVASDLAANQSEQKDTMVTTYPDLNPDQARLHDHIIEVARHSGADCRDVLVALDASVDNKAAVAEVLGGPGAGDEFRAGTNRTSAGQPVADPQVNPPTSNGGTSMEASNYESAVAALDQLAAATRDLTDHVAGATAAANQFSDHVGEVDEARRQVADAIAAVTEQLAAKGVAASAVGQVQAAMEMVHAGDLNSAMDYVEAAKNALAGAQAAAAEASSGVAAAQDDLVATYGDAHATMAAHGTDGSFIDGACGGGPAGVGAYAGAGETVAVQGDAVGSHASGGGTAHAPSGGGAHSVGVVNSGGTVSVGGDVAGSQTVTTAGQ